MSTVNLEQHMKNGGGGDGNLLCTKVGRRCFLEQKPKISYSSFVPLVLLDCTLL